MTTISFKPGATGPFVVRLEAEDGDPVAYVRTQVRVQAGAACLTVDGVLAGEEWGVDLSTLVVTPRLWPATIYYDAGDGWRLAEAFNLHILGGC